MKRLLLLGILLMGTLVWMLNWDEADYVRRARNKGAI